MKYTVLIINDLFDGENMLIIKNEGSEYIVRNSKPFTKKETLAYLRKDEINLENCDIFRIENDWNNQQKIEKVY